MTREKAQSIIMWIIRERNLRCLWQTAQSHTQYCHKYTNESIELIKTGGFLKVENPRKRGISFSLTPTHFLGEFYHTQVLQILSIETTIGRLVLFLGT